MKVTIQKIRALELIEGDVEFELATVLDHKIKVDMDEYRNGHWVLLEEKEGEAPKLHSILLLNEVDPREEVVIGMSSITKKLQLGPYEDAIEIKVGVDVTNLVKKLIK